jgi:hypothetical protein
VPNVPESLRDPKAALIALAQHSKDRKIREGFKPVGSSTIGPDYNELLVKFIDDTWNTKIAVGLAPSLARARARLSELAASVEL